MLRAGFFCKYRALVPALVLAYASSLACGQYSGVASMSGLPLQEQKQKVNVALMEGPASSTLIGTLPSSIPPSVDGPVPVVPPVRSTVEVMSQQEVLDSAISVPYHMERSEIQSSAGTWGDFSRYLQLMPGVVWNTDISNDVMVRGGNPAENLYVVDGIEIPNINHIALEGTTGGFTSMIDTSSIESIDMKAGVYDVQYSNRLSSLIDIHTRSITDRKYAGEFNFGISGIGGFVQRPLGNKASALFSGHRSILNLATDDIGINGVPIYTDGMSRMEWRPDSRDHLSILSLNGGDSIQITPQACDPGVTLDVSTSYDGLRSTTGMVWQHTHGSAALSQMTASYSMQQQNTGQLWQKTTNTSTQSACRASVARTSVYSENTRDGISSLGYGLHVGRKSWMYALGASAKLNHIDYAVAQPLGEQSPLNTSNTWTDATSFHRNFSSGQEAIYAEFTARPGIRWSVTGGAREEIFALSGAHVFSPRGSVAFRINEHQTANLSYMRSAQLAPTINIVSYLQNQKLLPIRVQQVALGADLWRGHWATVSVEAYRKRYTDEPVSTEYASLMLANMVDTLGQQFVWLPLKSGGHGRVQGVELFLRAHALHRVQFLGAAAYSHTRYAAADGVLRPGNFDFPLVTNGMVTTRLWRGLVLAMRDTYASGRPYTPFNISLSKAQSRGIYDLTKINAQRGPAYNRVDTDLHFTFKVSGRPMEVYGGVENALDRENFLGYAWMQSCHPKSIARYCGYNVNAVAGVPETKVTQMPMFPSAGMRWSF
jgi:hypothetical protein